MAAPSVEKDAGAEVLFWRVHLVDHMLGGSDIQRVFYHYVRLKVFSEKGKEQVATIDLEASNRSAIRDVQGRTIKPDGSILDLDRKSVFQRDAVRAGGRKLRVTSFAMPGVEPGAIIEYRWREIVDSAAIMYLRLQFSREYPVRKATYFVKPLGGNYTSYRMYVNWFNCKSSPVKMEDDGYQSVTIENVPAYRAEPYSPSDPNVRPWALLYYLLENPKDPDKFWNEVGKKAFHEVKDALKANDEIKSAAAEWAGSAKTEEEKAVALMTISKKHCATSMIPR